MKPSPLPNTQPQDVVKGSKKEGAGGRSYLLAVESESGFSLAKLPLVGHEIPDSMNVNFSQLRGIFASADLGDDSVEKINDQLRQFGSGASALPSGKINKGFSLDLTCAVPSMAPHTFHLHAGGSGPKGTTSGSSEVAFPDKTRRTLLHAAPNTSGTAPAASAATWLNVNKTLGPLTVRRLGAGYHDQELSVLLDATMKAGPLAIGVDGLGLGVRLDKLVHGEFDIEGKLSGLSIDYSSPPLEIGGAFLKGDPPVGYDLEISGLLVVKASKFSFGAIGAYLRKIGGQPSLFLFGELGGQIPGPPPIIITGLMGGFGYNSRVRIPTLEEVADFPFVAGLSGSASAPAPSDANAHKDDLLAKLNSLTSGDNAWVAPADGEVWIAAGVAFEVCKLVHARALLMVEFGSGFAISLLGRAEASLPPESDTKYANVELELEAVYTTEKAMLAIDALLTPRSFLLDPACHLTGGFAFHCWFDGSEHPGDFVLTAGGYHPQFKPPAHYPNPPRIGINWDVSDAVSIKGGSYLALTPSAFMVGGGLDVRYHSGDVRAWLTAHFDALVQWKPFHFDLSTGISLGASLNTHIFGTWTVEVGADIHLWGPPTGGEVTVHVLGIGLTVSFGEHASVPDPVLDWEQFTGLLPDRAQAVQLFPAGGLLPPPPAPIDAHPPEQDPTAAWAVSSHGFALETRTVIPASQLVVGKEPLAPDRTRSGLNIRPMGPQAQNLTSRHSVVFTKHGAGNERHDFDPVQEKWTVTPLTTAVPSALWGASHPADQVPTADGQLVPDQITGVRIVVPAPHAGTSLHIKAAVLESAELPGGAVPLGTDKDRAIVPPPTAPATAIGLIRDSIATATTAQARTALFDELTRWGLEPGADQDLRPFADTVGHLFADAPFVATH
ncbi:DUF6603 domain-containing protein [Streptomyces olivoreticuli]|uniref:DUF6603 domain-containing protein n=1 Tax=Streptomyces olivoreticuli TaxID=68246 RepID=UPI0013C34813|nr:DUF6603 domain-containing protein [Streptomyces olivoreticuli]